MHTFNWRKRFLQFLFVSLVLTFTTAVALSQPLADGTDSLAGNSSIKICLDDGAHPLPMGFSGDLGIFLLSDSTDVCHTAASLEAGTYTVIELLPHEWSAPNDATCSETAGSGASRWRTTPLYATIDLAAASTVECVFYSLPAPDEPNDSIAQATPITYGARFTAEIEPHPDVGPDGDKDFYRFWGYEGDTLRVDIDAYIFTLSDNDPWLYLKDAGGNILAQATTISPFLFLEHQLPSTGDYYLEMQVPCTVSGASCTGEYGLYLTIKDAHEPNDTLQTAVPINFDEVLRGNIDNVTADPYAPKDNDYFRFQGAAGDAVVIEVNRFNRELVPDCQLLDGAGTVLASHFGPDCRIEYTLPADGVYYINAFSQYHENVLNNYWRGPYAVTLKHKTWWQYLPVALSRLVT